MARPLETFKLPRGMGRLTRSSRNGPWTWQKWNSRKNKWTCIRTNEVNRSKAEQYVYQQVAIGNDDRFRYQGIKILFSTVADEFVKARTNGQNCKKLRPSTLRKINTAITSFRLFKGARYRTLQVDQIDSEMLDRFVRKQARHISIKAANCKLDYIHQILDFAKKRKYILRPAKTERLFDNEDPDDAALIGWPCPTGEEVRMILEHAPPRKVATGKLAYNGSDAGRRVYKGINLNDYTDFFAALCLTGMRLGEARFLTWDDVDLVNKVILIQPGHKNGEYWQPKTRASIRRIAIIPELEVILIRQRRINKKNAWVFETRRGTQQGATNPTGRFREICDSIGFEKHFVVHSLRKYWASTVAQQGMDWKVMLKMFGHSDFELILSTYYAQNDDARMFEEASKIDFGLGLPKSA